MTSTPALFDFLDRSHQELQRQLVALRRLVGAVADDSLDAAGRDELKCTIAWFNREARQHHHMPNKATIFQRKWWPFPLVCMDWRGRRQPGSPIALHPHASSGMVKGFGTFFQLRQQVSFCC